MIDGRGYGGRLKLEAMWNKGRPIDPQFVALGKFLFSYAYGIPGKMPMEAGPQKPSLIFTTIHGHQPWSPLAPANIAMDARSAKMNAENDAALALAAAERKAEAIEVEPAKAEPDAETLEIVRDDLPQDFTPGGGEGPLMGQRAPYRCQHGHLNGLGPQCYSKCRQPCREAREFHAGERRDAGPDLGRPVQGRGHRRLRG